MTGSRDIHRERRDRAWRSALSFVMHHSSLFGLALLSLAHAQMPTPSRLEQLEATYQANLRPIHAPILQDYLRQLELLKSKFAASGRADDARQVDAEIARVKNIASTTGILPYSALQSPANVPAPAAPPKSGEGPAPLPTFLAAEAFKGQSLHPKTGALPLGAAEWRIFSLPAGTYDLLMVFSCESLDQPESVTVRIGGQEIKATVAPERATGSVESFRLVRLCELTLGADVTSGTLALEAASSPSRLWVRKLMFAKPRAPLPTKS